MRMKLFCPYGFIFCLLAISQFSCQRQDSSGLVPFFPGRMVRTSISGHVVDENKLPVQGAVVSAGLASTKTDVNGDFQFYDVFLDKDAGAILVHNAGYFTGSRTILPKANSSQYIEIGLIPKPASGRFLATGSGVITLPNGGVILLAANSLISDLTNRPYTGTVSASAYYLNPVTTDFGTLMPGDLRGKSIAGKEKALQTFGVMAIELVGANKEQLRLVSGKTATIVFPIPDLLLDQAPAAIPLWWFEEGKGLWVEEGLATRQNNNFVGNISHFSFWSCNIPFDLVEINGAIQDKSSQLTAHIPVTIRISGDSSTTSGSGFTDETGNITGKVPANKPLEMLVYNQCGALLHSQNIGPFNSSASLGEISVMNSSSAAIVFTGRVISCTNTPVADGFVNIFVNGKNYRTPIRNGIYSATIPVCSAGSYTASLTAFDQATRKYSSQMTLIVNSGSTLAITLTAC